MSAPCPSQSDEIKRSPAGRAVSSVIVPRKARSDVGGMGQNFRRKSRSSKGPVVRCLEIANPIHDNARRQTVILVVVENPLLDGGIASLYPAVIPLDRRGS